MPTLEYFFHVDTKAYQNEPGGIHFRVEYGEQVQTYTLARALSLESCAAAVPLTLACGPHALLHAHHCSRGRTLQQSNDPSRGGKVYCIHNLSPPIAK